MEGMDGMAHAPFFHMCYCATLPPTSPGSPWLLRPARLDLYISPGAVAEIVAELRTLPLHHMRRQQEKGQLVSELHGCLGG
jgi:hypothetical protein